MPIPVRRYYEGYRFIPGYRYRIKVWRNHVYLDNLPFPIPPIMPV